MKIVTFMFVYLNPFLMHVIFRKMSEELLNIFLHSMKFKICLNIDPLMLVLSKGVDGIRVGRETNCSRWDIHKNFGITKF